MSEKDELCGAPAAIGMVVLELLFGGVVLAIYPGWAPIGKFLVENLKLTENAPAWVQAIGSIGAICVAIFVPYKIHTDQLKNQKEIRMKKALVFKGVTRLRVAPMQEFSEFFDYCLKNRGLYNGKIQTCENCIDLIERLNFLSQEEISLISEFDPEFAYQVTYIMHMLKAISFKLETRVLAGEGFPGVATKDYYIKLNNEIISVAKKIKW